MRTPFVNEDDQRLADIWTEVRKAVGDTTRHASKFYSSFEEAPGIRNEVELCARDAEAGNERAQRYMLKFLELRMRS